MSCLTFREGVDRNTFLNLSLAFEGVVGVKDNKADDGGGQGLTLCQQ